MSESEILAILAPWNDTMRECELRLSEALVLIGGDGDAPLPSAVVECMTAYTRAVAGRIDWDADTLIDWWAVHEFGARPLHIWFHDEPMRSIDSIEALVEFITEDLRRITI